MTILAHTDTLPIVPYTALIRPPMLHPLDCADQDSPYYDILADIYHDAGPVEAWGDAVLGVREPGRRCIGRWLTFYNNDYIGEQRARRGALALWRREERRCRGGEW